MTVLFVFGATAPVDQGLLIHNVSRSHTTTHHSRQDSSGRVISSSQRPLPDNTQHSQQTIIHAPGGNRTKSLSRRTVTHLRLRPRGHWDRLISPLQYLTKKPPVTTKRATIVLIKVKTCNSFIRTLYLRELGCGYFFEAEMDPRAKCQKPGPYHSTF